MNAIYQTHRPLRRDFFTRWQHPLAPWVMAGSLVAFPFSANSEVMDLSSLQLNGSATTLNTAEGIMLQLTPAEQNKAGSAFTKNQVNTASFSTFFTFRIEPHNQGAEGLVFVVQSVKPDYLGEAGSAIGYSAKDFCQGNDSSQKSLGVEFDTWLNGDWAGDTTDNHVAINTHGCLNTSLNAEVVVSPSFKNGRIWYAWIDYDGSQLEVRTNQTGHRPDEPLLAHSVDLTQILGGTAFVGFTSSTGYEYAEHNILSWMYQEQFGPITLQEQIAALEKQIQALQQELAQLQKRYASCQSALEESTQDTGALQQELAQLQEQYASLQSELEEATQKLEEAKLEVVALQQEFDKARNVFAGTNQDVTTEKRLTDNGDGTVTDNLTGLIWLKNANCGGRMKWNGAHQFANTLFDGSTRDNGGDCGLSDKSKAGDWRLPGLHELFSLIDLSQYQPALPSGHQFSDVKSYHYWSSSASAKNRSYTWYVNLSNGKVANDHNTSTYYVWPVRDGV